MEIGGGFGGLAAELVQFLDPPVYYLVELPDALPLAFFYLKSRFSCPIQVLFRPEEKADVSSRIVLAAPWKLDDLEPRIDLAINTMSFQRMDMDNLRYYFGQIDRLGTKRMYLVNRNRKRDLSDVVIDQYPIPGRLKLIKDQRWPFGEHRERFYLDAEHGRHETARTGTA